jgi:hypothetical protein
MGLGFAGNRLLGGFDAPRVTRDRPSRMDGTQPFGPDEAQVGDEICGPCLRCLMRFCAWAGPNRIWPLGRLRFKFFC